MEKTNWYAVFTASRAEKRVKERLEQAGIENYLPVRAVEFVRDGQKRRLEIPVITGCIFVRVSSVISSGNDLPFMNDHTANGDFLQYFCLFRLADGFFHKTFLICKHKVLLLCEMKNVICKMCGTLTKL